MSNKRRANNTASLRHERAYYAAGYRLIFGIDEAGRGPWAGPLAAGAVCLPLGNMKLNERLRGIRDSKQMTNNQRTRLVEVIRETAQAWGIGQATVEEINESGLVAAAHLAQKRALDEALTMSGINQPDCLFLDYMLWPQMGHIPQVSIVSGDQLSLSIACASVLAKTWRDAYMDDIAQEFPLYGFESHKGYGTAQHQAALRQYGVTPLHRIHYEPIQVILRERAQETPASHPDQSL